MATADEPRSIEPRSKRQRSWTRHDGPFRFTVDQFYQLADLGFFEDRHVELIAGVIYEMTVLPPHATATRLTEQILRAIFGAGWLISVQMPFDTGRKSLPEPDLAVVPGTIRDYRKRHPTAAILVIEVSQATLRKDRTLKGHIYAQAGLPEYWIVNLVDRQLEVHRDPGPVAGRRGRFGYRAVTIVPEAGNMAPLSAPGSPIAVADLLP